MCNFKQLTPQKQYIVGQMVLDGFSLQEIDFFVSVLDALVLDLCTIKQMAYISKYSQRTTRKYLGILQNKGYVKRERYREWVIEYPILKPHTVFEKDARRNGVHI